MQCAFRGANSEGHVCVQAQGELDEAEALLTEAAGTAKQVLGSDHPHTKIFEINLKGLRTAKMKRDKTKQRQRKKEDQEPEPDA